MDVRLLNCKIFVTYSKTVNNLIPKITLYIDVQAPWQCFPNFFFFFFFFFCFFFFLLLRARQLMPRIHLSLRLIVQP
jgi:hypothetical protein